MAGRGEMTLEAHFRALKGASSGIVRGVVWMAIIVLVAWWLW
jgi:hypothetical protein